MRIPAKAYDKSQTIRTCVRGLETERGARFVGALAVAMLLAAACSSSPGSSSLIGGEDGTGSNGRGTPGGTGSTDPDPVKPSRDAGGTSTPGTGQPTPSDSGAAPTFDAGMDSGGTPGTTPATAQERLFRALQKDLTSTCGGPNGGDCHVRGTYAAGTTPPWLGEPDAYVAIKRYPGIVVKEPSSSRLLTKPAHAGPMLNTANPGLATRALEWLTSEAQLIKGATLPATEAAAPKTGANSLDLAKAAASCAGGKITFDATMSNSLLTLSNLKLVAPTGTGVHVVHPIFVVMPATGAPVADPVDSFSNIDQTVAAGATAALGPGTLILSNWQATAQLQIQFTSIATATTMDGGTTGGCKSVATFTSQAVPVIQANTCLNCHNGSNQTATAALDLTQVGKDNALACGQALSQVDLANKAQSPLILAPTGGIAAHPFKTAPASYTTGIMNWLANE